MTAYRALPARRPPPDALHNRVSFSLKRENGEWLADFVQGGRHHEEEIMVRGIGGAPGIDPRMLRELEELEDEVVRQSLQSTSTSTAQRPARQSDRSAAAARLHGNVRMGALPVDDMQAIKQELEARLRALGYLPKSGNVTREQFDAACRKLVVDYEGGHLSIEELMALLDMLLAKENQKRNPPRSWRGEERAHRPGFMPPSSAPTEPVPVTPVASPPPPPGQINAKIAEQTRAYMGTSTVAGPDGGNLACAWSVNNILANAGVQRLGDNPNYVPSVEEGLQGGRGAHVSLSDAQPGDIVIWPDQGHIGIYMGNGQVAHNSSSRAAFVNLTGVPSGARLYRVTN